MTKRSLVQQEEAERTLMGTEMTVVAVTEGLETVAGAEDGDPQVGLEGAVEGAGRLAM